MVRLRWPCGPSIDPFSCATPRLLRETVMPVMGAQRPIALGHVVGFVLAQIAEGRRQAVGAVLPRRAAEMPERVLQTLRQRREALAAEHHPGMGEARPGQAEVIEHVTQLLPGDAHAEGPHMGEV